MVQLSALVLFFMMSACSTQDAAQSTVIDIETFKSEVLSKDVQLLDVRTPDEYNEGHIDDAININYMDTEAFSSAVKDLDKTQAVYVYCQRGGRSKKACAQLEEMGFQAIFDYSGGYSEWSSKE